MQLLNKHKNELYAWQKLTVANYAL